MMPVDDAWMWWSAERLLTGSVQGALIAGVVWVVCRCITAIPASARALLWWLVSLKLVVSLFSLPSLALPLLPAEPVIDSSPAVVEFVQPLASAPSPAPDRSAPVWLIAILGAWAIGVLAQALHLFVSYRRLRRTVRHAMPLAHEDALLVERLARQIGLRTLPRVCLSDQVDTPLVAGMIRPVVLLPARAAETLSSDERAMAIGHELAHVRRRDLLLGWVPAIAERLFFFHPLARLAAREYAAEREAACDALVLHAMDVAPRDYGQMLLRLGVAGARPVFTASGSSPSPSSLRRRLDMLNDVTFTRASRVAIALVAFAFAAVLLPFHLVAEPAPLQVVAPVVEQVAPPVEVGPPQTPREAPPATTPTQVAPPVRSAQPPTQARPVSPAPARVPVRTDADQIEKAIDEQRAKMRETERALMKMRQALEAMLVQQQQLTARTPPERVTEMQQRLEQAREARRSDQIRTEQILENQLRVLKTEQERTSAMLRQLQDQIEQIRRQLEFVANRNK